MEAKEIFMEQLKKGNQTKLNFDEEAFNKWFSLADVNNDGSVSFDEAYEFVKSFLMKGGAAK